MTSTRDFTKHPVFRALDPAGKNFMEARRLSSVLNPFADAGLPMHALIPFGPFPHIKTIAAVGMMVQDHLDGHYEGKHTIVVDSSGNTAHAVARLAPAFGFADIKVILAADVPESKKSILNALSTVEIIEIPKGRSVAARAREEGAKEGHYHLDQYKHLGNMMAHHDFTAPEIKRVLGTNIGVIAIAMGSGGTAAGIGRYFKSWNPKPLIIGVRPKLGDQVPGARDEARMREVVTLPWQDYVDYVVDVPRKEAFVAMRRLWREVEPIPGPTSGLAYAGLLNWIRSTDFPLGFLQLEGAQLAFICPDDGRFYTERTTGELDPDQGV